MTNAQKWIALPIQMTATVEQESSLVEYQSHVWQIRDAGDMGRYILKEFVKITFQTGPYGLIPSSLIT